MLVYLWIFYRVNRAKQYLDLATVCPHLLPHTRMIFIGVALKIICMDADVAKSPNDMLVKMNMFIFVAWFHFALHNYIYHFVQRPERIDSSS